PKGGDTEGEKRSAMMWEEQVTLNFPLLYLASWYVYQYAKERGIKTLLFATRDCCHWVKIFQKMFPDMTAHYFHCSRNLFEKVTEMSRRERHRKSPENVSPFRKYILGLVGASRVRDTMYVDVHGTCKRAFAYFEQEFGEVPWGFL